MTITDKNIDLKKEIESIFSKYRKHKYYTLFIEVEAPSITSTIDDIGGGQSNLTTDKVGNAVTNTIYKKNEAKRYVNLIEEVVDQLPDLEKEVITLRYMNKDYNYMSDHVVYQAKMKVPISAPYYNKLRERAFNKIGLMLLNTV